MKLLQMNHVQKSFNDDTLHVLKDISLSVEKGEVVAIIGPSGSGKSTLLRCAAMLTDMDDGELFYGDIQAARSENGRAVYAGKETLKRVREKFGLVFQSFNLIDELNVEENIELPLTYLKVGKAERKQKVQEVMKRMGITHRAKHFPHQLSGGQQQRVAIARAVVFGPKLILADEPTGNLDSKNGAEVMRLLTELNQDGTAIVMVTHNEHDAQIAHRTIRLFDGKIIEQ